MTNRKLLAVAGTAALGAALFAIAPASGAPEQGGFLKGQRVSMTPGLGFFTPAAADPRLAAAYARGGLSNQGFRFTPVGEGKNRAVTVAVRAAAGARSADLARPSLPLATLSAEAPIGIEPVSYSLGAAVGWKRFALAGDADRTDILALAPARDQTVGTNGYNAKKWSSRVQVSAERPLGLTPKPLAGAESYSLDVGGSYRLTRNLDVTAGVRYRTERDRLEPRVDDRRDSQAVYVGTAFRF